MKRREFLKHTPAVTVGTTGFALATIEATAAPSEGRVGYFFTTVENPPAVGLMETYAGSLIFDTCGLIAYAHPYTALVGKFAYGPKAWLHRAHMGGRIVGDDRTILSTKRVILESRDASDVLRIFAASCAHKVVHLWDAPEAVRMYLENPILDLLEPARRSFSSILEPQRVYLKIVARRSSLAAINVNPSEWGAWKHAGPAQQASSALTNAFSTFLELSPSHHDYGFASHLMFAQRARFDKMIADAFGWTPST